jgi:hypothetical protein
MGAGGIIGIVLGSLCFLSCFYRCCCRERTALPAGSEAIAPADDGWGPYKPILAITNHANELIPGKFCTSKNMAFYSYGGKEHETRNYKMVRGTILEKGVIPPQVDAVGF